MTIEQLERINATLKKQRDDAERKVSMLTMLIDNELLGYLPKDVQSETLMKLKKIGV